MPGVGERLDPTTLAALADAARQAGERAGSEALAVAAAAGVGASVEQVPGEVPHRAIVAAADRLNCDLIVMASHGRRGVQRMLLGSQTQKVLLLARQPVLVIH